MKVFFLFILCLLSFNAFCQREISTCNPCLNRCEILNVLLKDPIVQRFFDLKIYSDTSVILIDTTRFFDKCNLGNINGRNTKFVTDSLLIVQANNANIFVFSKSLGKGKYMIEIYSKYTHGYGWMIVKERHKKFYSVRSAIGILD
jgi:hypothetical protein